MTTLAKTDYCEGLALKFVLDAGGVVTYNTYLYLALFTTPPTEAGGGVECSGASYARVQISGPAGVTWEWVGNVKQNTQVINFPIATANWPALNGLGIMDAASGGNCLWYAGFNSLTINSGQRVSFAIRTLQLTEL